MSGVEITRATFTGMPTKDKLNVLFDLTQGTLRVGCENKEALELLDKKVNKRWKLNASIAAVTGFLGGVCAHIGQGLLTGKPPTGV
ncbi:MAG: hypothetical protein A2031_07930 [Deltaproteobacteria bacterium RBG_19FT_COMBO_43_11]|nr:MAG: hypothetical protein A2W27_08145 [Deltaproteobacteria bacterium RBG_16_44_11]OGP87124.1 MAG: hypothetical protein A2031_07930 [Deltaproteobacteria bacterium RBG_19FT_COMBO_43_11]